MKNATVSTSKSNVGLPTRKLKVCQLVCTADGGTWMFEQLRELRDKYACQVTAVVSRGEGRLVDKLRAEAIPYHVANFVVGIAEPLTVLRFPFSVLKLARFFRRERFDVVQSHVFATTITARPAAWLADVPVRLTMIAGPFHLQARISLYIERATYWMDRMLIASCQKSLDLCTELGISKERLAMVYYSPDEAQFDPEKIPPADIRSEFGWPPETPLICMVAYFYHRLPVSGFVPPEVQGRGVKGHEDFVRAAPMVLADFPDAKFLLIGSAWDIGGEQYMEEMKALVREMGLESKIIFTGYRADTNQILRAADVAVQASLSENLGGTIEALLMECPTVATRVGGMVDAVLDGETGILVSPQNPHDLARGISELLRDPKSARAFGQAGRKFMLERFTLSRTAKDLAELYHRLLSEAEVKRRSYNLLVSLARLFAGVPVFVYLVFRLIILDFYLQFYLRVQIARIRAVPSRLYFLVRSLPFRVYSALRGPLAEDMADPDSH